MSPVCSHPSASSASAVRSASSRYPRKMLPPRPSTSPSSPSRSSMPGIGAPDRARLHPDRFPRHRSTRLREPVHLATAAPRAARKNWSTSTVIGRRRSDRDAHVVEPEELARTGATTPASTSARTRRPARSTGLRPGPGARRPRAPIVERLASNGLGPFRVGGERGLTPRCGSSPTCAGHRRGSAGASRRVLAPSSRMSAHGRDLVRELDPAVVGDDAALGDVRHRAGTRRCVHARGSTSASVSRRLSSVHATLRVVEHHALGRPGRARRVDDGREVVAAGPLAAAVSRSTGLAARAARPTDSDADARRHAVRPPTTSRRRGSSPRTSSTRLEVAGVLDDRDRRAAVAGEVADLVRRRGVVDRDRGGAEQHDAPCRRRGTPAGCR